MAGAATRRQLEVSSAVDRTDQRAAPVVELVCPYSVGTEVAGERPPELLVVPMTVAAREYDLVRVARLLPIG